jgi:hypothetical protein
MRNKIKPCSDCGADVKTEFDDPKPICDECLDIFMARGGRSDPFWFANDIAAQRMVDAANGDL